MESRWLRGQDFRWAPTSMRARYAAPAMPRPSLANVAVAALFALVVIPRAAIPLIDGDVWWHVRAGADVLETLAVARTDTWTIVGAGMPWTSQDWLSNVLLAWLTGGSADGGWGATAASVTFALLAAAAAWLLWRALSARGVNGWLGRVVWLSVGFIVAGPALGVRVQVIDLTLAAATVMVLWSYLVDPRRRWLIVLPIIAVSWANLHAGWVLLFLLGGAVLTGEVLDRRVRPGWSADLGARQLWELAAALVVAIAAVAVNPSGVELYRYPIETAMIGAHRDFLAEWSPPALTSIVGQVFWTFVVAGVGSALVLGWRSLRSADLLVLLGLTLMAATAARFLLMVPIAAAVVSVAWATRPAPAVVRRMGRPAASAALASVNAVLIGGVALAGVIVTAARVSPGAQERAIGEHMPVKAVTWMLANDPGTRVFNTYSWGGYLGLRRPSLPVYIDGRSDIYGDAPIREYARAVLLETNPAEILDRQRIDHVLFGVDTPLADWLDGRAEWERLYADDVAAVWGRVGGE